MEVEKHLSERMYTCHSLSYNTLSCIYLLYASVSMLPKIKEIKMPPQGISAHCPLLCYLQMTTPQADRIWRLSRFWIEHPTIEFEMAKMIREFWLLNADTASPGVVWEAFKRLTLGAAIFFP